MDDSQRVGEPREVSGDIVSSKSSLHKGSGRILVMDDEPVICQVIGDMLRSAGFEAITAPSGAHAIELFRKALAQGKGFDVAILDLIVCGGMGGEKTVKELYAHDPRVVALALSGYEQAEVCSWNESGRFMDFLKKPFLRNELLHKVEAAMAQRTRLTTGIPGSGVAPRGGIRNDV